MSVFHDSRKKPSHTAQNYRVNYVHDIFVTIMLDVTPQTLY